MSSCVQLIVLALVVLNKLSSSFVLNTNDELETTTTVAATKHMAPDPRMNLMHFLSAAQQVLATTGTSSIDSFEDANLASAPDSAHDGDVEGMEENKIIVSLKLC